MRRSWRTRAPFSGPQGARFRSWVKTGYAEAKAKLGRVHDEPSYDFLLQGYAGGFYDSHIRVRTSDAGHRLLRPIRAWPGFGLRWSEGVYSVNWITSAAHGRVPPVGAVLLSCDGEKPAVIALSRLHRFDANLNLSFGRYLTASRLLVDEGKPRGNPFGAIGRH